MVHPGIADDLTRAFPGSEGTSFIAFLKRGRFCTRGQKVIADLLLDLERSGRGIREKLVELLEKNYREYWDLQNPDVRGDSVINTETGQRNRTIIEQIRSELQIVSRPKPSKYHNNFRQCA